MTISLMVILVQQREIVQTMRELNKQVNVASFNVSRLRLQNLHRMKKIYQKCRSTTANLCAIISAYSRQWSPFISAVVPVQVLGVSYLSYLVYFSQVFSEKNHIFIFFTLVASGILFVETNFCAQIVRYNLAYTKLSTLFTLKLHKLKVLSPVEELKFQLTTVQKQFAFKFADGNSINSQTFPLVSQVV